jgi:hypothetical protein
VPAVTTGAGFPVSWGTADPPGAGAPHKPGGLALPGSAWGGGPRSPAGLAGPPAQATVVSGRGRGRRSGLAALAHPAHAARGRRRPGCSAAGRGVRRSRRRVVARPPLPGALGLALAHGGGRPLRPVPSRRGGARWRLPPLTGAPTLGGCLDRLRPPGVPPRVPLRPCPPDLLAQRAACPAEPIRGTDHLPCHQAPLRVVSVSVVLSTCLLLSCGRVRHPQLPIPRRGEAGGAP